MDIQATIFCDWPSPWIFKMHFYVIGLLFGYSNCIPLRLASYPDIQAVLLCDWYPTWIFKLAFSVIGILPGYSRWFFKDSSSFWISNLSSSVLTYIIYCITWTKLSCDGFTWIFNVSSSVIGRFRPVSELLSELESSCKYNPGEKLYVKENVDVDLTLIFYVPIFTPYLYFYFPTVSIPQSKELGRGPSGIVSTFWRKVSPYRWQRSNEAVQMTIILIEEWFVSNYRTRFCLFMTKNLNKTTVGKHI